jgi:hypothetical protein
MPNQGPDLLTCALLLYFCELSVESDITYKFMNFPAIQPPVDPRELVITRETISDDDPMTILSLSPK